MLLDVQELLDVQALPWGRGGTGAACHGCRSHLSYAEIPLGFCLVLGGQSQILANWLVTSQLQVWPLSKASAERSSRWVLIPSSRELQHQPYQLWLPPHTGDDLYARGLRLPHAYFQMYLHAPQGFCCWFPLHVA